MTQAGASARYRFDVAFAEAINYNFYHSIPRISLVRSLMKRRKREQSTRPRFTIVISTFWSERTVSCNVRNIRSCSSRTSRIRCRRSSPLTFPRAAEAHVRSARWGMTLKLWKSPTPAKVSEAKPSPNRSFDASQRRNVIEERWKRDERRGGHKSTRELRFSFLFTPLSCRALNLPARKSSKRLTPMPPVLLRSNYSPRIKLKEL